MSGGIINFYFFFAIFKCNKILMRLWRKDIIYWPQKEYINEYQKIIYKKY